MELMNNSLIPTVRLYLHKLAKITHRTIYYEGKYGIKAYNKPLFVNDDTGSDVVYLPAESLFLSYDGLKDPYTLVNKCILDSPHIQLMKLIENGEDIYHSDYVEREQFGYLDGRFEIKVNKAMLDFHIQQFQKTKALVLEETYDPPAVYCMRNKYYLIDGKHRAAVCGMFEKQIKCKVVPTTVVSEYTYTRQLLTKMRGIGSAYSQNIEHIKELMDIS
jgi:hypothetical protein